jgi:hypothetical protein
MEFEDEFMWIALPEAVTIYARFCQARYGTGAGKAVRDKARELKRKGDLQGHEIWNKVAQEIDHLARTRPPEEVRPQSR